LQECRRRERRNKMKMSFGNYIDEDIEDIPNSYLNWLLLQEFFEDAAEFKEVQDEMAYRKNWNIVIRGD